MKWNHIRGFSKSLNIQIFDENINFQNSGFNMMRRNAKSNLIRITLGTWEFGVVDYESELKKFFERE